MIFKCDKGHYSVIEGDERKLTKKASTFDRFGKPKLVCPQCQPNNIPIVPVNEQHYLENLGKKYVCKRGHITKVTPMGTGCNISWGREEFENIKESHTEFDYRKIKCRNSHESEECGLAVKPLDDSPLEPAQLHGFKVKTRVGDIWDKNRCPRPIGGHYDLDQGEFKDSAFSERSRERTRGDHLHVYDEKSGKQIKIKKTRRSEPKGEIISKRKRR